MTAVFYGYLNKKDQGLNAGKQCRQEPKESWQCVGVYEVMSENITGVRAQTYIPLPTSTVEHLENNICNS